MAGFIHIKNDTGLPINSVAFNAIVEFSRIFFSEIEENLVRNIYAPIDEGGMNMISLDEEGKEEFNAFYNGIKRAYDSCNDSGKCGNLDNQYFSGAMQSWRELLELLENDTRYAK